VACGRKYNSILDYSPSIRLINFYGVSEKSQVPPVEILKEYPKQQRQRKPQNASKNAQGMTSSGLSANQIA
jgi:hypothetical protein